MFLEVAILDVKPPGGAGFEAAFGEAQRLIEYEWLRFPSIQKVLEKGSRAHPTWENGGRLKSYCWFQRVRKYKSGVDCYITFDPFPEVEHYMSV